MATEVHNLGYTYTRSADELKNHIRSCGEATVCQVTHLLAAILEVHMFWKSKQVAERMS